DRADLVDRVHRFVTLRVAAQDHVELESGRVCGEVLRGKLPEQVRAKSVIADGQRRDDVAQLSRQQIRIRQRGERLRQPRQRIGQRVPLLDQPERVAERLAQQRQIGVVRYFRE